MFQNKKDRTEEELVAGASSNVNVAIIAGDGDLPKSIYKQLVANKTKVKVVCLKGFADTQFYPAQDAAEFGMASIGNIIKYLKENNIKQIVFAGGVQRPDIKSLKPDMEGIFLLAKIKAKMLFRSNYGDDRLLSDIIDYIEGKGFEVVSAHNILQDLTVKEGIKTKTKPSKDDLTYIKKAMHINSEIGKFDIGQALVIEQGSVIAVEAAEGTDKLIARAGAFKKNQAKPSGILVKTKKPAQSELIDMPTIGLETINQLAAAGLKGIAIQAGSVYVLDQTEIFDHADSKGIFFVVQSFKN